MKKGLNKFIFGGLIILLVFMPMIFALDTQLNIKTNANNLLTIRFQDVDGKGTLENGAFIDKAADANGDISVTFSSDIINNVKISVGGSGTPYKYFRDIKTGWIYTINMNDGEPIIIKGDMTSGEIPVKEIVEEVVEEVVVEEIIEEVVEETNKPIIGLAIDGKSSVSISKKIIYSVIGVVLITIIILVFLFLKKKKSKTATSVVKFRDKKDPVQEEEELEDAERRIKEAEKEIKEIRNKKSALEEAEKKFEEDKKRLEELKGNISR